VAELVGFFVGDAAESVSWIVGVEGLLLGLDEE
jgi:hypothetical protein